jgi:hypothetical protein
MQVKSPFPGTRRKNDFGLIGSAIGGLPGRPTPEFDHKACNGLIESEYGQSEKSVWRAAAASGIIV